ncbi:MAG: hypothetical protein RBT36_11405, partial [Desulfobulbus sp.]|nr:hypothetical protein [Desulfobulbus sp.]
MQRSDPANLQADDLPYQMQIKAGSFGPAGQRDAGVVGQQGFSGNCIDGHKTFGQRPRGGLPVCGRTDSHLLTGGERNEPVPDEGILLEKQQSAPLRSQQGQPEQTWKNCLSNEEEICLPLARESLLGENGGWWVARWEAGA